VVIRVKSCYICYVAWLRGEYLVANLTDTEVRRTKPGKNDKWLADGNGLYVRITPGGARSWWFRQSRKGRRLQDKIGTLDEYTLVEARLKAAELAVKRLGSRSVSDLVDRWFKDCIQPDYRRPHHVEGYLRRAVTPILGEVPLRKVAREDVVDMLAEYRKRGTVGANNLRRIVRQMFAYGVELGWIDTNPADGISARVCGPESAPGERVLNDSEIRQVWDIEGPHRDLLRLLLLTGLRISEAQRATWAHLDGERLHIPAEHSKNARAHWVHLPALAFEVIGKRGKASELILREVSVTAAQSWVKRYCAREGMQPWTPHDLRRTYATRINGLKIAPHVAERCLNHTLQGVMAVYNRAEYDGERIEAAEVWAAELARILGRPTEDKVVRLRAER
jgi:integrase